MLRFLKSGSSTSERESLFGAEQHLPSSTREEGGATAPALLLLLLEETDRLRLEEAGIAMDGLGLVLVLEVRCSGSSNCFPIFCCELFDPVVGI